MVFDAAALHAARFNLAVCGGMSKFAGMNNFLSQTWRWSRRYISLPLLIAVAYMVFILGFNENSYFKSMEYQAEIDRLTEEIKENTDTMQYYRKLNAELSVNPEALERIVREQYHMQRPGEDVYVFE